jgi:serine/threonine-protein kinase
MIEPPLWEDVKEILLSAIELPADERSQFLARACESDQELRTAVEALLSISTRDAAALDNVRLDLTEKPPVLPSGTVIDNFHILELIGLGGMGIVYLAQDERTDRKVALKILKTRTQFNRGEHMLLAKFSHPFIATLYETGKTRDGLQYLAMEYVAGLSLVEHCDKYRPSVKERLALFKQICEGVQYAHQNLVVHRDLKPKNILVTPKGEPKILDFGIAKEVGSDLPNSSEEDLNPMTLPFASPEQRQGQPIGPTSDIYALGILLCGLLTGRHPHAAAAFFDPTVIEENPLLPSNLVESNNPLILAPPPDEAAHLKNRIRGDLDAIIAKALQPDPAERYQTAEKLGEDIDRHLTNKLVSTVPASLRYRTTKLLHRRPIGTVFSLVLFVMLVLLIGQYRRAIHGERQASAQAQRTQQINRFVVELLRRTNPFDQNGSPDASVDALLDQSSRTTQASLNSYPDLKASFLSVLGAIYGARGDAKRSQTLLQEALALQRRGPRDHALAETLQRYGAVLESQGSYRESEAALSEAQGILGMLKDQSDPVLEARILMSQALNRLNLGDYEAAHQLSQAAVDKLRHSPGSLPELAASLHNLGHMLDLKDREAEAEALLGQALSYAERMPDANNPYVAIIANDLGNLMYKRGDYAGARTMLQRALEINRTTLGEDSTIYAVTLHNLAALDSIQGRYQESLAKFTQVLAILQKHLPPNHQQLLITRDQLASTLIYLHEYRRAEMILLDVLAIERKTLPKGHPSIATTLNNLAYLYQDEGRFRECQIAYQEALEIFEKLVGRKSRPVATLLGNLGSVAQIQGDNGSAELRYREALDIARGIDGGKTPDTINALTNLAYFYIASGDFEKAGKLVREVIPLAKSVVGPTGRLTGSAYLLEAKLLVAQEDFEGALSRARQAKTILTATLPPGDWRIAATNNVLGAALGMTGSKAEAEQLLLHSLADLRRIKGDQSLQAREAADRVRLFYRRLGRDEEALKYQNRPFR